MLSGINAHFFPGHPRVIQTFFHLHGEITLDSCSDIIEGIIECNTPQFEVDENELGEEVLVETPAEDVINLLITSPGGDMAACFALIEVIKGSKIPVRTIAIGEASSAGLCILMAGHQRVATPYTSLMSHAFATGAEGPYHELKNAASQFDAYFAKMVNLYLEFTGLDESIIRNELLSHFDKWMTAPQAKTYNFIDLVSDLA
jgi:ATP-dependent protease ClpP protease subunit